MITLTYLLSLTITALLVGITAFTYSNTLTKPGEIFSGLYGFLDKLFNTEKRMCSGLPLHPLFKLLIACEKCVAGQMAFWFFLLYNLDEYVKGEIANIFPHILFVGASIYIANLIKLIHNK